MIGDHNNKIDKSNKKTIKKKETTIKHSQELQKSLQLKLYFIQYMSLIQQSISINEEKKSTTIKQIKNMHFGDDIQQEPKNQSTNIFFRNVNGLELNTISHTLLKTHKRIQDHDIGIACHAKTNTNWKH